MSFSIALMRDHFSIAKEWSVCCFSVLFIGSKQFATLCVLLGDVVIFFGPIMVLPQETASHLWTTWRLRVGIFQAFYGVLVEMLAYCNVLVRGNRFECDRLSRGVLNDFGACHAKLCVLQFRNLQVR